MSLFQWANNVNTTLAAAITNTQTTITLASSSGLPSSIPAGVYLPITLNDVATRSVFEVLYATAVSGATLTVIRGQEGTTPQAWNTGDYAYSTISAGSLSSLLPTQTALQIITVSGPQTITPKALTTLVYPNASSVAITLEAGTGQGQRVVVYGNAGTVTVNSSVSSGSPYFGFPDGTVAYSWIVASIGYLSGYFSGIEMVYDGAN
ncbi:MAG: hypothetical protein B7X10_00260 [Burkholderiales bacterium 21-58-4]|nr:MAG: hypothetical protein B7X10_00260 [Burkholderiales bacterium 21-58-4]